MNESQAEDELFAMLLTAWNANARTAAGTSTTPVMLWDDQTTPPTAGPFARATLRHQTGKQTAFGSFEGKRHYERAGTLTVQCFGVGVGGRGVARALARVAKDAFEGKASPSDAWFRNCRTVEIGPDDRGFYQINALIEFEYGEYK